MLEIKPIDGKIDATVTILGSKSYTNRALLVAALADGKSTLKHALFSDDTFYMTHALGSLGIELNDNRLESTFEVIGTGGKIPVSEAKLFIGNAGTAARFLTSYLTLGNGTYSIDGVERMRQRPIGDLLDGLRQLGASVSTKFGNGCPPVLVKANGLPGGKTVLNTQKSSQFLSSILLSAPYAENDVEIEIEDKLVSKPYIDITLSVMSSFGVQVEREDYRRFFISSDQCYQAREYTIEPDASSASYFFAAAALVGGRVKVMNLSDDSVQGDVRFVEVLRQMGCEVNYGENYIELKSSDELNGIEVDMNEISDTAQTLAAIAPFAKDKVFIKNIGHIRRKETDRITAIVNELRRLKVEVDEFEDSIVVYPSEVQPTSIETYNDHRMAMSFAVIGLKVPGIKIKNPECVNKTFPNFFDKLKTLETGGVKS